MPIEGDQFDATSDAEAAAGYVGGVEMSKKARMKALKRTKSSAEVLD